MSSVPTPSEQPEQPEQQPASRYAPVENDMHVRSGVAHGAQTSPRHDGTRTCNICGKPA